MKGVIMFEMIIGVAMIIAGAFGAFALSESIDEYMQNHNHVAQLD